MCFRNRDIIDEENPYDAVTIEEDTKIYEDLVSYQKVVPVRLYQLRVKDCIFSVIIINNRVIGTRFSSDKLQQEVTTGKHQQLY